LFGSVNEKTRRDFVMWKIYLLFGVSMVCLLGFGITMVAKESPGESRSRTQTERLGASERDGMENGKFPSRNTRSLEAKLAQKDLVIASLLADKAKSGETAEDRNDQTSLDDRLAATMQILDDRIAQRYSSSSGGSRLRIDVQDVIDEGVLQNTEMIELSCAKDLCKLALSNENHVELNHSVISLSRSLGKAAGGLTVFDGRDGEKVVYIAESSKDLVVDLPGAPVDDEIEEVVIKE
jgi:hypothetical protein